MAEVNTQDEGAVEPTLETRTRTDIAAEPLGAPLQVGDPLRLDRYEIIGRLGVGGMGVVYEAFDPQLRRRVALKVLRPRPGADTLSARLVLEGQALARLSHPNVVEVYGVGTDTGRLWLAMELVRGGTLRDWLRSSRFASTTFDERLHVVLQAGHGLAAAHEAGIIHRDFKPANVLIGDDGRVRVADFGIAQQEPSVDAERSAVLETAAGESGLTKAGRVVGTPKYMAPEQRAGETADERSDQYAFGLTAWEVLHGRFPFASETLAELRRSQREDKPAEGEGRLPAHVSRTLRRAVSLSPRRRRRSMTAVTRGLSGARRGVASLALAAASLTVVGLASGSWTSAAAPPPECAEQDAREALGPLWSRQRAELVTQVLSKTGPAYAEAMSKAVGREVSSFSADWAEAYTTSCRRQAGRGVLGRVQHAATVACLSRREGVVRNSVERLEAGLGGDAQRAASVVRRSTSLDLCRSDREAVAAASMPSDFQDQLAVAEAAASAGDTETALKAALGLAELAKGLGDTLAEGDALGVVGVAYAKRADSDDRSAAATSRAYELAVAGGFDSRAAAHARTLAQRYSFRSQPEKARFWQRHAVAASVRAGLDPEREASLLIAGCYLAEDDGPRSEAVEACEKAFRALNASGQGSRASSWRVRARLALAYNGAGRAAEARTTNEALLVEAEAAYGPFHPRVGGMHLNLGRIAFDAGRYALALTHYEQSLAVFRRAYHPQHRWVLSAMMNIANIHFLRSDFAEAERVLSEAIALAEHREDAQLARLLNNLASVKSSQGNNEDAIALLLSVQRLESTLLPKGDAQTGVTHLNLAEAYAGRGRLEEAVASASTSVAIREAAGLTYELASAYRLLASYLLRLGRLEEAEVAARKAVAAIRETEATREEEVLDLLQLAEVLRARGKQRSADDVVSEAWATVERAETAMPRTHAKSLFARAKIEARKRKVAEARALVTDALSVAKGNPDVEKELNAWLATLPTEP